MPRHLHILAQSSKGHVHTSHSLLTSTADYFFANRITKTRKTSCCATRYECDRPVEDVSSKCLCLHESHNFTRISTVVSWCESGTEFVVGSAACFAGLQTNVLKRNQSKLRWGGWGNWKNAGPKKISQLTTIVTQRWLLKLNIGNGCRYRL